MMSWAVTRVLTVLSAGALLPAREAPTRTVPEHVATRRAADAHPTAARVLEPVLCRDIGLEWQPEKALKRMVEAQMRLSGEQRTIEGWRQAAMHFVNTATGAPLLFAEVLAGTLGASVGGRGDGAHTAIDDLLAHAQQARAKSTSTTHPGTKLAAALTQRRQLETESEPNTRQLADAIKAAQRLPEGTALRRDLLLLSLRAWGRIPTKRAPRAAESELLVRAGAEAVDGFGLPLEQLVTVARLKGLARAQRYRLWLAEAERLARRRQTDALRALESHFAADDRAEVCRVRALRMKSAYWAREREDLLKTFWRDYAPCRASSSAPVQVWYAMRAAADTNAWDKSLVFARMLAKRYPKSVLADDALYFAGRLAKGHGDEHLARELLTRVATHFADGDMADDATTLLLQGAADTTQWASILRWFGGKPPRKPATPAQQLLRLRAYAETARIDAAREAALSLLKEYPRSLEAWLLMRRPPEPWLAPLNLEEVPREPSPSSEPIAASADFLAAAGDALKLLALGEDTLARTLLDMAAAQEGALGPWVSALLLRCMGDAPGSLRAAQRGVASALPQASAGHRYTLLYPLPHRDAFAAAADKSGMPLAFLYAIARSESAFEPTARSRVGAAGLMQLMPAVAQRLWAAQHKGPLNPARLDDPELNLALAAALVQELSIKYDGHPLLVAAAYNAGASRVDAWLKRSPIAGDSARFAATIPYKETRRYVRHVLGATVAYKARLAEMTLP